MPLLTGRCDAFMSDLVDGAVPFDHELMDLFA